MIMVPFVKSTTQIFTWEEIQKKFCEATGRADECVEGGCGICMFGLYNVDEFKEWYPTWVS